MALPRLRAPEGHLQAAVLTARLDAQGVFRGIDEVEVWPAPGDGGVQAGGHVALIVAVVRAEAHLQVRQEAGAVESAAHLADAAPHLAHQFPVHIAEGAAVARFLRPLADAAVEAEFLPRQQQAAVQGLRRQADVHDARFRAPQLGLVAPQLVPVQQGLQLFRRHHRLHGFQGDHQGPARVQALRRLLCGQEVEAASRLFRRHPALFVPGRVLRRAGDPMVKVPEIRLLRVQDRRRPRHRFPPFPEGGLQGQGQGGLVRLLPRRPPRPADGLLVEVEHRRGHGPVRGLGDPPGGQAQGFPFRFRRRSLHRLRPEEQGLQPSPRVPQEAAAPPVGIEGAGDGRRVLLHAGLRRGDFIAAAVGEADGHALFQPASVARLLQPGAGLRLPQSAQRQPGGTEAGIQPVRPRPGFPRQEHEGGQQNKSEDKKERSFPHGAGTARRLFHENVLSSSSEQTPLAPFPRFPQEPRKLRIAASLLLIPRARGPLWGRVRFLFKIEAWLRF